MPESVKLPGFSNRSLGWDVNTIREPSGWSPREYVNIKGALEMLGLKGSVRWRNYQDHGTFANMLADLGSDTAGAERFTVLIPDNVVIAENTTVPGNLTLVRVQNGKFTIAGSITLTFNSGSKLITEPDVHVFDVTASSSWVGNIAQSNALEFVTPDMFGGGELGLSMVETSLDGTATVPCRIFKDIVIDGYVSLFKTDIEYIKPGVTITVEEGGTLIIDRMSSKHCHNAIINDGGTITIGEDIEGLRTPSVVLRVNEVNPSYSVQAREAILHVWENGDGSLELRVQFSGGTYGVVLTPTA